MDFQLEFSCFICTFSVHFYFIDQYILNNIHFFFIFWQGTYQVAKWNGTKVSVKILDQDSYSDPESMYALTIALSLVSFSRLTFMVVSLRSLCVVLQFMFLVDIWVPCWFVLGCSHQLYFLQKFSFCNFVILGCIEWFQGF